MTPQPPSPTPPAQPQVTVLIVDDERLNRTAVAELLLPHYRLLLAKDGTSALKIAHDECTQLGLVLLDVSMPDLSGYEVLERLRADKDTAHIPVIFITGQSDEVAEEYGLRLGAADYVSKPIRPAVLLARVKNQVELFLQKRRLEELALVDGLTGLSNRRHFDLLLDNALRRCQRTGEQMGLTLVDIDHFKQFNDLYSHMHGDEALRTVARLMRQHAQRTDEVAARYGGEEFAFIHVSPCLDELPQHLDSFRFAVQELQLPNSGSMYGVLTVSIGLLVCDADVRLDLQERLSLTDQLLYAAKNDGRNCVRTRHLSA